MEPVVHLHPRERLAERVVRELEQSIATGELAPGELLPAEAQLALRHRVSSRVVREALVAMHRHVLVAIRRHQPRAAELAMERHLDLAELHLRAADGEPQAADGPASSTSPRGMYTAPPGALTDS